MDEPIQERIDFVGGGAPLRPRAAPVDVGATARVLARELALSAPLVFLDLETTGLDPTTDRIVEITLARVSPQGAVDVLDTLLDPGLPVPPQATAIHGIGDADVAGAPTFPEVASRVVRQLRGADLAGYNLLRFDLPLLRAEMERAGLAWDWEQARVVDASVIYRRMERRTLEAAHRFYVGHRMEAAHTAAGDVAASMAVLAGQLRRYGELPRRLPELAEFCTPPIRRTPPASAAPTDAALGAKDDDGDGDDTTARASPGAMPPR